MRAVPFRATLPYAGATQGRRARPGGGLGFRRRERGGFSLIDLLVAFTIFSIALMGVLTIFPTSMKSIRMARINIMATHLAQQGLENAFNLSFNAGDINTLNPCNCTNPSTSHAASTHTGSPPSNGPPSYIYTGGTYNWTSQTVLTTTVNGTQEAITYYTATTVTVINSNLVDYDIVVYWYDSVATNNTNFTITYNGASVTMNHSYTMEAQICNKH